MPHIEIIAGVGAGKSALAKCLQENGFELVEEEFENNPFLEKFHQDPWSCALEFGITILAMHYHTIASGTNPDKKQVFDFSLVMNQAYALTYKEFGLFNEKAGNVYINTCKALREEAIKPALRIYLQISPEEQKRRILQRGRPLEKDTPVAFLAALKINLEQVLETIDGDIQTLVIDAETYNWVTSESDKRAVVEKIVEALNHSTHITATSLPASVNRHPTPGF